MCHDGAAAMRVDNLLSNTSAFAHSALFDPNHMDIGIVPITECISRGGIIHRCVPIEYLSF